MPWQWLPEFVIQRGDGNTSYTSTRGKLSDPYDLITEHGRVMSLTSADKHLLEVTVVCKGIPKKFRGFRDGVPLHFVLKSTLSQLGIKPEDEKIKLNCSLQEVEVHVKLRALSPLAVVALSNIRVGAHIGKLFAAEGVRRVRETAYVDRLLNMMNCGGELLLKYNGSSGSSFDVRLVGGRAVVFLPLRNGASVYGDDVHGFIPTIGMALKEGVKCKYLLRLHQRHCEGMPRVARPGEMLIVCGYSLCMRTMFARVVEELLPKGLKLIGPGILEPSPCGVTEPQDIAFAFYGDSTEELTHIPMEFFTLESYREHVPYALRKTLKQRCESKKDVLRAFKTMPRAKMCCCTFITKGGQFNELEQNDWVTAEPTDISYRDHDTPEQRHELAQQNIYQQCEYGILSAIAAGDITSEGVLLTRNLPSPSLKSLVLSCSVAQRVRAIYFSRASGRHGNFFSQDDHAFLTDLDTFGIDVFFVDMKRETILQYVRRPDRDVGVFAPTEKRREYLLATFFGVYGSNLVEGTFEDELHYLFKGLLTLKEECKHPQLNPKTSLALVTGGGPGAMEVGNRVAKNLGILSCGMLVDFASLSGKPGATINEQVQNPYVEAFMTYRWNKLVERQSDFNLDFPIFLMGGIGTDFEYALEEVRRKVGAVAPTPIILFGSREHFESKITGRYQANLQNGTIRGSEWISNVPWVVGTGREALEIYVRYFSGRLPVGPGNPSNELGFVIAAEYLANNPS
ncbi:uncharacterized protein TEOVI_000482500 [Trypanosoma equiperdum]|uniref:Uncharacterized protein n=2 Tax=Trypanozoon TaxID=39700 RepID=Q38CZ3_TRYB2|nr:hypothetical protein, conserved [Trypanosoma brucei brucei TREU927]EAN77327.1 hypothetical protein, conserved [Trypanosoma brucei brucei TREU927]SCU65633.1 hypothetical protein, conserved [Trypanosoma equiperdum]